MTTQFIELETINDQQLQVAAGGIVFVPFAIGLAKNAVKGAVGGAATYGGYKAGEAIGG